MAVTPYVNAGQPPDTLGVAGDICWDTTNRITWVKQSTNSWVGGGYSNIGPTGPAMLAGSGAPASGFGQIGNGYVDATTGNIYLKSSTGWSLTGTISVNTNNTAVLQGSGPPNSTTAPNVVVGQMYLDTTNQFLYPPAVSASAAGFTGAPINVVGPTGPAMQVQPALANLASTWGPGSVLSGYSASAGVYVPSQNAGVGTNHAFTPFVNCSLTGVQITNFGATNATAYLYLADSGGNIIANINAGNGVANGTVVNYPFTAGTYPLVAGKSYQWMVGRAAAGNLTVAINPAYTMPSTGPGVGYYPAAVSLVPGTAVTLSSSNQYLGTAGLPGQQWYYKYQYASWMYGAQAQMSGSGTIQLVLYNTTSGAAIWTSPVQTLTSALSSYSFGPFPVNATFIPSGANCCWAVIGSGTLNSISISTATGM